MTAVSTTSDLSDNCTIPGCKSLGIIRVGKLEEDACLMCTMHYHKLLARMKEEGMDEDDTDLLGARDILDMTTRNEFQHIVKRIVEDEEFKKAVRKAARKGRK